MSASYLSGHINLILPKPLKPIRCQLSITNRMLNILVPHVVLDGPGVLSIVGKLVTACADVPENLMY